MYSISYMPQHKFASCGAQLVPIGMPCTCLYTTLWKVTYEIGQQEVHHVCQMTSMIVYLCALRHRLLIHWHLFFVPLNLLYAHLTS